MKLNEIINILEKVAPLSLQEEWDNCGFQIKLHSNSDEINNVFVALEITYDVINEAIKNNSDLIITHHPLFFGSFKSIDYDVYSHKYLDLLIKNHISVYSSHTCFDICDGGNNDYFGKVLGLKQICKIDSDPDKIIRYGDFDDFILVKDLAILLSNKFNIDKNYFNYAGPKNLKVKRIAWVTGSGADYLCYAKDINADLFITGDLTYHKARDAREMNIPIISIGHYASEQIFVENIEKLYKLNNFNVITSKIDINPFEVL